MDPDDLLAGPAVEAAVAALAERNRHHLEQMSDAERQDALGHWRELAITVLTAARSAAGSANDDAGHGRATIVLEDAGGEEVTVHATFWPEMQDLGRLLSASRRRVFVHSSAVWPSFSRASHLFMTSTIPFSASRTWPTTWASWAV